MFDLDTAIKAVTLRAAQTLGLSGLIEAGNSDYSGGLPEVFGAFRVEDAGTVPGPAAMDTTHTFNVSVYYGNRTRSNSAVRQTLISLMTALEHWQPDACWDAHVEGPLMSGADEYESIFGATDAPYTAGHVVYVMRFIT